MCRYEALAKVKRPCSSCTETSSLTWSAMIRKRCSARAAAALAGATLLSAAEPVAAREYEYCREDYSSGMRQCGFATVEQCVAMISGRGGSCVRNPRLSEASTSYAHAPKRPGHPRRHHGAL